VAASEANGMASAEATATIARQQAEIEQLRRRLTENRFAEDLRDALTLASATGTIGAPVAYTRLLEMIVKTAADIINATAAVLFLVDTKAQDLVFEVALGEKTEAEEFRVPLDHGVAGLVARSGHPMAISDAADDDWDTADAAQAVGFVPKNILCVPLTFHDQIIGVMELLDKEGGESFTVGDMEAMGLFANLAAVAIVQSRTHSKMGVLVVDIVEGVDGVADYDRDGLTAQARDFTEDLGRDSGYLNALRLARLVQQIVHHGDAASDACVGILRSFAEFLRSRPTSAGELGGGSW
jgi:putative methionine-R-sulfoxide reductase with GAF domain